MSTYPHLDVHLLGPLELIYCAQDETPPVALPLPPTAKAQSLLAYLILHTDPPPRRENLAALFWPDRPPRRARRSLSTALWHIRRCFPVECLQSDSQTVRFAFPGRVTLDVSTFEQLTAATASPEALQRAVALYRGDFLAGFYDDWALGLRYRLQARYLDALTRLMRIQEAQHADQAALQTALQLLSLDPLSEAACQVALRAYSRLGQREAALALYRRFAATLRRELDTEPASETIALYQRLVAQSAPQPPAAPPPTPPPGPSTAQPPPTWITFADTPPLVARDPMLDQLRSAWAEALTGRLRIVWVCGTAGIGKTRLVETFAREAHARGGTVLWGRCTEWEREPYAVLSDLLRAALLRLGEDLLTDLSPWQRTTLAQLLPEGLTSNGTSETGPFPVAGRRPLLRTAAHLLAAAARRVPLVVVIEDLHWATDDTLAWLPLLIQSAAQVPLLLIGTCRREEIPADHPLPRIIGHSQSAGLAQVIELPPFTLDDLHTWLPHAPTALIRSLHQHTGGNPFFILETLRALVEGGHLDVSTQPWTWQATPSLPVPDTVRQALSLRWAQLPSEARQALEVAAVLGRAFDLEPWRRAWGHSEEEMIAVLDTLLRRGWVVEGQGPFAQDYAFVHHLAREVVYHRIPPARRRALHLRAAQALSQTAPEGRGDHAAIAFHFLRGEAWDQAWRYLIQAGDHAAGLAATSEALHCYQQAAEARRRASTAHHKPLYDAVLARKIGEVHFRRGEYEQAEQALKEALVLLNRPFPRGLWATRRALISALGKQLWRRGLPLRRPPSPSATAKAEEVSAYTVLGWIYSLQGRHEAYLVVSLRALNAAEEAGLAWGEAMAATALGIAADFIPWFGMARYFHQRALRVVPLLSRPNELGFVHFGAAYHYLLVAEEGQAKHHAQQAAEAYRRAGAPQRWALAMLLQGYVALYRGLLDHTESLAQTLIRTGEEMDAPGALSSGWALRGLAQVWRGAYPTAGDCFRQAIALAAQIPDYMAQVENLGELARCEALLGHWDEAQQALRQAEHMVTAQQVSGDSLVRLRVAAATVALMRLLHQRPPRHAPAWQEAQQAMRWAWRSARHFWPARPEVCRLIGAYAWLRGQPATARRWWQRGLRLAREYGHPLDWAVLALEAGALLPDPALSQQGQVRLAALGIQRDTLALWHRFLQGV